MQLLSEIMAICVISTFMHDGLIMIRLATAEMAPIEKGNPAIYTEKQVSRNFREVSVTVQGIIFLIITNSNSL